MGKMLKHFNNLIKEILLWKIRDKKRRSRGKTDNRSYQIFRLMWLFLLKKLLGIVGWLIILKYLINSFFLF